MIDASEDESGEKGTVFTSDSIIWISDTSNPAKIVMYSDIADVDFGGENVYLKTSQGIILLWCGENADEYMYPMRLYSFISDILDDISVGEEVEKCLK